jgi:hypothetical protein
MAIRHTPVQWTVIIGSFVVPLVVLVIIASFWPDDAETTGTDAVAGIATDIETVGAGCLETIVEAASIPPDQDANDPLLRSAYECKTVDEWVMAVRAHPEAMGQLDPADIDPEYDLSGICFQSSQAPVCIDATRLGLDTYWVG